MNKLIEMENKNIRIENKQAAFQKEMTKVKLKIYKIDMDNRELRDNLNKQDEKIIQLESRNKRTWNRRR